LVQDKSTDECRVFVIERVAAKRYTKRHRQHFYLVVFQDGSSVWQSEPFVSKEAIDEFNNAIGEQEEEEETKEEETPRKASKKRKQTEPEKAERKEEEEEEQEEDWCKRATTVQKLLSACAELGDLHNRAAVEQQQRASVIAEFEKKKEENKYACQVLQFKG
jgi:hypothetical protein